MRCHTYLELVLIFSKVYLFNRQMIRKLLFIAALFFVQTVSVAHSVERHEHDGIDCVIYVNSQQTECYILGDTIGIERPEYSPFTIPLSIYVGSFEGFELPDIRAPPYFS